MNEFFACILFILIIIIVIVPFPNYWSNNKYSERLSQENQVEKAEEEAQGKDVAVSTGFIWQNVLGPKYVLVEFLRGSTGTFSQINTIVCYNLAQEGCTLLAAGFEPLNCKIKGKKLELKGLHPWDQDFGPAMQKYFTKRDLQEYYFRHANYKTYSNRKEFDKERSELNKSFKAVLDFDSELCNSLNQKLPISNRHLEII